MAFITCTKLRSATLLQTRPSKPDQQKTCNSRYIVPIVINRLDMNDPNGVHTRQMESAMRYCSVIIRNSHYTCSISNFVYTNANSGRSSDTLLQHLRVIWFEFDTQLTGARHTFVYSMTPNVNNNFNTKNTICLQSNCSKSLIV